MDEDILIDEGSIVGDIILSEEESIAEFKDDMVLYVRTRSGRYIPAMEFWQGEVNERIRKIFKKKKMKFTMSFTESLTNFSKLKPYSARLLVYLVQNMTRENMVRGKSIRAMRDETNICEKYIYNAFKDFDRFNMVVRIKNKNTFDYMINPAYFTRASLRTVFPLMRIYHDHNPRSHRPDDFITFDKNNKHDKEKINPVSGS